jgi:GNAT superfamily N-acetyltransferase
MITGCAITELLLAQGIEEMTDSSTDRVASYASLPRRPALSAGALATLTTFDEPNLFPLASVSGARFRSLRPFLVLELFERLVGRTDPRLRDGVAWGAFEDRTELIGACALVPVSERSCRVHLAVVPERRRLGIGAELLHIAMADAGRHGVQQIVASYRAGASEAEALLSSVDAIRARRVCRDDVEVVVFIPATSSPTQEGTTA